MIKLKIFLATDIPKTEDYIILNILFLITFVSPLSLSLPVPVKYGADVGHEPEGIQYRQQVQQSRVRWIIEPGFDRNSVVYKVTVTSIILFPFLN